MNTVGSATAHREDEGDDKALEVAVVDALPVRNVVPRVPDRLMYGTRPRNYRGAGQTPGRQLSKGMGGSGTD